MIGTTVRATFPIRRRDSGTRNKSAVGEAVVALLRPAPETSARRPSRVARQLALAHYIERLIEAGALKDYAEAARALGLTRARLTQVMHLRLLSPEIQERVLVGEKPSAARGLRCLVGVADWSQQVSMADNQADRR